MAIKELEVKEALQLLLDNFPNPVKGSFWSTHVPGYCPISKYTKATPGLLVGMLPGHRYPFDIKGVLERINHFAIEVPDEYRYMTQQEHLVWLVTTGYKDHQMRHKSSYWYKPFDLDADVAKGYEYRTVQEIDGKIVYGEPQEFKVRI